jgi:hexosaminidase
MPFYPKSTIEQFFDWNPATEHPSLREEVLAGVEAAIWCESIESFADLLFLILPRLPGIGEKGWSQAETSTWQDYQPRLAAQAPLWRNRGWNFFQSSLVDWR